MIWLSLAIVIMMSTILFLEQSRMNDNINKAFLEGFERGKKAAEEQRKLLGMDREQKKD